jgi:hypothetical protein
MRWSSRVGDLAKLLIAVGPHTPDHPLQRLRANLSGSNPYTTPVDVNRPWRHLRVPKCTRKGAAKQPSERGGQASDHLNWHAEHRLCH